MLCYAMMCYEVDKGCLFDILSDPTEQNNRASANAIA